MNDVGAPSLEVSCNARGTRDHGGPAGRIEARDLPEVLLDDGNESVLPRNEVAEAVRELLRVRHARTFGEEHFRATATESLHEVKHSQRSGGNGTPQLIHCRTPSANASDIQ